MQPLRKDAPLRRRPDRRPSRPCRCRYDRPQSPCLRQGHRGPEESRDRNEDGSPRTGVSTAKRGLFQIYPDRRPLRHPEVRPDPRRPDRHRGRRFTLDQLPPVAPFCPPVAARPRRDPRRGRDRHHGRPGAYLPPRPREKPSPGRRRFASADLTGGTRFCCPPVPYDRCRDAQGAGSEAAAL